MVLSRISEAGMALLDKLDAPLLETHHLLLGHLGSEKLRKLLGLLSEARQHGALEHS